MNLGAVFCVGNLTCSFHMLHSWPTQFYVGPPTLTFLATLVAQGPLVILRRPYPQVIQDVDEIWRNLA